jgi:hypothetical protein
MTSHDGWVAQVLGLPRITRLLIVVVFALAVTLALNPMIDWAYLEFIYTGEASGTDVLPSLIAAAFGVTMYTAGWFLIIGTVGGSPPVRRSAGIYLIVGVLAIVVVIIWAVRLVILGSL